MILYCPSPSVTAVRDFSIRAGLDASTVTPGMTPPLASRTTPAIACANAVVCPTARQARANTASLAMLLIRLLLILQYSLTTYRIGLPDARKNSHRIGPAWESFDAKSI